MSKFNLIRNYGMLVLAFLLGGCGSSENGTESKAVSESAEITEAQLEEEFRSLDTEEENLKSVGLKFEMAGPLQYKWNESLLQEFRKNHPKLTIERMIPSLDRYIEKGEHYLKRCETYREKRFLATTDDLLFVAPKVSHAKNTRKKFQATIDEVRDQVKKDEERRTRERREEDERLSKSSIYPYRDYLAETGALDDQTAILETMRIRLPETQTEVSTRGTDIAGHFDDEKKTKRIELVKVELITRIQAVLSVYSGYVAKYGSFPYRLKGEASILVIQRETDFLPDLARTLTVLRAKISLLDGIITHVSEIK